MRETEILRGLGKAKANRFADGMSPVQKAAADYRKRQQLLSEPAAEAPKQSTLSSLRGAISDLGGAPKTTGQEAVLTGNDRYSTQKYAAGVVRGPGTGTSDSIDAKISNGEAVLPEKTVEAVGANNIARLIEETNGQPPQRGLRKGKFADGYVVRQFPNMKTAIGTEAYENTLARANGGAGPSYSTPPAGEPPINGQAALDRINASGDTMRAQRGQLEALNRANSTVANTPQAAAKPASVGTPSKVAGFAKSAGKMALAAAPVMGAVQAYNDSDENVKGMADTLGLDYNKDMGRIGANAANWLVKTGDAATFGLASKVGETLGRTLAGGSLFEKSTATPTASKATVPAATAPAGATAAPATIAQDLEQRASPEVVNKLRNIYENEFEANTPRSGSTDLVTRGNEGVRSLRGNARARDSFNALQEVNGTGVVATRDENGGLTLSNNPAKAYKTEAQRAWEAQRDAEFTARGYGKDMNGNWQSPETAKFVADRAKQAERNRMDDEDARLAPSAGDSFETLMAKKGMRDSLRQRREQEQADTASLRVANASRYATDSKLLGDKYAADATTATARAKTLADARTANQKAISDLLDRRATQMVDGKPVLNPELRNELDNKFLATFGKYGINPGDVDPASMNEFIRLYEQDRDGKKGSLTQAISNFINQRDTVVSDDLADTYVVGMEPGVFQNSAVLANGNHVNWNNLHGADGWGDGGNLERTRASRQTIRDQRNR